MEKYNSKILYIITKADLGGVSKYLLELINNLPKNFSAYFIISAPGYLSDELKKLGIIENVFFVPMTNSIINIPLHIKSNLEALRIIKKVKPDFIHCNSTTGGIIGRICGFISGTPVIFTVHGWAFTDGISKSKQIFYKALETILALFTKKIICVSEYDKKIGLKLMPFFKSKLISIHNGISDIKYSPRSFSLSNELKIVMISRFCPQKDPYTLIKAVSELNKEGLNIKLDLYGYGDELERVLKLISLSACKNIKYKGKVTNSDCVLYKYDVYALISNWEGLPIGVIEALRMGLPIIVSDVGGNSELVNNNGFLVPRKNKLLLKGIIKKMYYKKENLPLWANNSRNLYLKFFTADNMVNKTIKIYEGINE